ncbi:hypothetical protein [uncultured Cohaesibacter sp.]|uniref:hypothetical protein n=1 Tax=uncultured Cohaesibacter sp. TaxID=1002546 RepID=UPI002AAAF84F|nr:hypothetical protein [uncultured Cohaesibacter sp.]
MESSATPRDILGRAISLDDKVAVAILGWQSGLHIGTVTGISKFITVLHEDGTYSQHYPKQVCVVTECVELIATTTTPPVDPTNPKGNFIHA